MLYFTGMNVRRWKIRFLIFLGLALALNLFSRFPAAVEKYYSLGIYPVLGKLFRGIQGWLPFSLGDLLYLLTGAWLLWGGWNWLRKAIGGSWKTINAWKFLAICSCFYLWFNIFWGLNYNRLGISNQLKLDVKPPDSTELSILCEALLRKTNGFADGRAGRGHLPTETRRVAVAAFKDLSDGYPFLAYAPASVKTSLFGTLGNYLGYTGYFNPLTGEAQVNETVPGFLLPFVTCHEIAHQLGYAKENEANFVGFLAARASGDSLMRYSAYLDMFLYANGHLFREDSAQARANIRSLSPIARRDLDTLRAFRLRYRSPVEDWVDRFYTQYLRLNQQPEGMRSYGRVVLWLMAAYRKDGDI